MRVYNTVLTELGPVVLYTRVIRYPAIVIGLVCGGKCSICKDEYSMSAVTVRTSEICVPTFFAHTLVYGQGSATGRWPNQCVLQLSSNDSTHYTCNDSQHLGLICRAA
jgi:hypothetical protein